MKTKWKLGGNMAVTVKLFLDEIEFPSGPFGNPVHLAFRELCERYAAPVETALVGNVITLRARINVRLTDHTTP